MGDHNSKHAQEILRQEHWPLIASFGWERAFNKSEYLIVYMTCYEHLLNLAEVRRTVILHCVPERQVYARDNKRRMTQRKFFNESNQFCFGRLTIKDVEIGKNHAGNHYASMAPSGRDSEFRAILLIWAQLMNRR